MQSAIHHNTASQHVHGAHWYALERIQMCCDTDPLSPWVAKFLSCLPQCPI